MAENGRCVNTGSDFLLSFVKFVSRQVDVKRPSFVVRERQLRLYGHVAQRSAEDPVHRILSCRDPRGWTMPKGVHTLHG